MPVDGAKCKMLVEGVLKEAFAAGGEKKAYNKARVAGWSAEVLSGVCDKMSAMEEADFKFIATCTLMETNGAGFHTSSTGYWEAETDGAVAVKHEVSRALSAIVSVFWVESQTMNVPAPADHALEPSVMKELAEKNIVEVAREMGGYDHQVCKASAKTLMAGLTKSLVDLSKPFKYIVTCTFLQRHPTAANECGPFGAWDRAATPADGPEPDDFPVPEEGPFKVQGATAGGFYTSTSALWDTSTDRSVTAWRDITAGKGLRCIVTVHACYEGQYADQRPQPEPAEGEPESEDA